jgi:ribosomal protein L15
MSRRMKSAKAGGQAGVVAHAYSSRTKGARAGGWKVLGKLGLHPSKFQAASAIVTPYFIK